MKTKHSFRTSFLISAARLALLTAASVLSANAHAQSSVTISGMIDESLMYTNNYGGSSRVAAVSNARWPSDLEFNGVEDLGSGSHAIFKLQSLFLPTNGTELARKKWIPC
ncbi:hypothetical protein BCh11DRAFT_07906 [Burkholderia sp. Ch1-1]|nr:hypothetical protein BCh11DRAFT_07906 [Burkholderia sp. Ch1-1]